MIRKICSIVLLVLLVSVFVQTVGIPLSYADDTAFNQVGTRLTDTLTAAAKGPIGKGLFYLSLFSGIVAILFTKHRGFGIVALLFGILIGGYTSIADTLWTLFNK